MAETTLGNCDVCGGQLSQRAYECPHCGDPTQTYQKKILLSWGQMILMALFLPLIFLFIGFILSIFGVALFS